jgi:hypothetical protein
MAPSPLWPKAADDRARRRPAILVFKSDQFVNELTQTLATDPSSLPVAQWESARLPPAGTPRLGWTTPQSDPPLPLKLFQPVHGRFYMVAASFVCQQPGLPDHALKIAKEERVYFVLRRLSGDGSTESAWVPPDGSSDPTKRVWKELNPAALVQLAPNEELIPLFPVAVPKTATSPARRIHAGLLATASRETFELAPTATSTTQTQPSPASDPRVFEAIARVVDPYAAIVTATRQIRDRANLNGTDPNADPVVPLLAESSAFLMLDFAEILQKYVLDVYKAVVGTASPPTSGPGKALYDALNTSHADASKQPGVTWVAAMSAAVSAQNAINNPATTPPFPTSFNLFNADLVSKYPNSPPPLEALLPNPDTNLPNNPVLGALLADAISPQSLQIVPFDPPESSTATPAVPKLDGKSQYVIRCVFLRCALKREKFGALFPPIVSDPSGSFEIAPFFDSDAPARTIRIPMPSDTSPAALRKFPRSVGFILGPQLQKQLCQVSDMAQLLKGQLKSCDDVTLGEICCFSMPIITIIAMILMIIMAIVLNIVFWWLPFLRICLPVPSPSEPEEA